MLPGPALIQADLEFQKACVDKKIQQHVAACPHHSVELDRAFILAVEIGSSGSVGWNGFWNQCSHIL